MTKNLINQQSVEKNIILIVATIKGKMKEKSISNYRLSKMTGINKSTIGRILNGKNFDTNTMLSIFDALGIESINLN